ncbi:MAG: amidohydrolase family protein [Verrucomicrobia bacterium]|nr:amidohydrolase family protein [Verrucomicrobiota bacterium]
MKHGIIGMLQRSLLTGLVLAQVSVEALAESILLKNGMIHTITHGVINRGEIMIQNDKITLVANSIDTPADQVIDLEGKHVYPGMIAMTTTLGLLEINAVRSTLDTTEVGQWTPEILSWRAVNPDSELIPVARANGITHAQPIPLGGTVSGQSGVIQLDGWTTEDLMVRPSVGLHVFWPSMKLNHSPKALSSNPSKWKAPMEQAKQRKQRIKEITEFFESAKAYVHHREADDSTVNIPNWESTLSWVKGEIPLFIHANEKRQIESALKWATEQNYQIVIVGGRDAWMVAELLAEQEIPVIYEHTFTLPQQDVAPYDVQFSAPSVLTNAGVKVIFSEGSNRFAASAVRNLPNSAAQAVAFGLEKELALKGLTLYPAQLLGLDHKLGSIETGKEASLIVLNGELLDIRSQVTHMWIKGKPTSLTSRHTKLYEKYRSRPRKDSN